MNAKAAFDHFSEPTLDVADDDVPILEMVQSAMAQEQTSNGHADGVLTLALDDLLADANGEIVLFNDSNMRAVALETSQKVLKQGEALTHETAGGDDVTGFHFMSFENGTTLYFQDGLNVIVTAGG